MIIKDWTFNKAGIIPHKKIAQQDYAVFISNINPDSPCLALGYTKKECEDNAEYICKAVNNHDKIIFALSETLRLIEAMPHWFNPDGTVQDTEPLKTIYTDAKQLLKEIDNE